MNLEKVLEQIIGKDLKHYDYHNLDRNAWGNYHADAQKLLREGPFKNELDHYITDLIQLCAKMPATPLTTDKLIVLTNIQLGIVVLETLRDRLKAIEDPSPTKSTEDIHAAI